MTTASAVSIKNTTRGPLPRVPFEKIAQHILGKNFQLSLVVCGDSLAQRLNAEYRQKTYKPNVLSFPLSKSEGEIFLNIRKAAREAKRLDISSAQRIAHLFVHGCYHLKGMDHSDKMERLEDEVLSTFELV